MQVDADDITMTFDSIFSAVPEGTTVIDTGDVPAPTAVAPANSEITNLSDTSALVLGMLVTGTNIPVGATITNIDVPTQTITLSTPVIAGAGSASETLDFTLNPGIAIDLTGTSTTSLDVTTAFEVGGVPGNTNNIENPDGVIITLP
jgi:hypothetical protein